MMDLSQSIQMALSHELALEAAKQMVGEEFPPEQELSEEELDAIPEDPPIEEEEDAVRR